MWREEGRLPRGAAGCVLVLQWFALLWTDQGGVHGNQRGS